MTAIDLESRTLGERHKHYNQLLKEAIANSNVRYKSTKIDYEVNDVDNLLRIDVACARRQVEYVLEVLKCKDLLYVSRALRRCAWLVTERQYEHIINPEYLHEQLFPHMTAKAICKLLLHVRLHLKDEPRVEQFYNYFTDRDLKTALKWLPNCSLPFIENVVKVHACNIKMPLLKRLCKRSYTILEIIIQNLKSERRTVLETSKFLLNSNTEKYLDIVETVEDHEFPDFGKNHTITIIKTCPQRIIQNFGRYVMSIDFKIFVKCLKREDAKRFLLKNFIDDNLRYWLTLDKLKPFIQLMPDNQRFEFLKQVFIDKIHNEVTEYNDENSESYEMSKFYSLVTNDNTRNTNIYYWYNYAPFDVALTVLKNQINLESSPEARNEILTVLLTNAGRNLHRLQILLQYYRDKHINEPFKFKNQFINNVITSFDIHKCNEETWNILNEIFLSMDVYADTANNKKIQPCLGSIIVYKVLHKEKIPEIIENKFEFSTLSSYQKKLNDTEKDTVFYYLHNFIQTKVNNKMIVSYTDFNESITMLEKSMDLVKDWKKELIDFPWILDKIKEFVEIKKNNPWNTNLSSLYNKKKSWRRAMFEESLSLCASEATCLNALKHDLSALAQHEAELETLRCADGVSLWQLLYRLRIYWPLSLAVEWTQAYRSRLSLTTGHRALAHGLCVLLPPRPLHELLRQFAPTQPRIEWSQPDELAVSLRKQFAKSMYLARPHPPPDVLLQYAVGDYLQYAMPSLNAIFYNMSPVQGREHILKLLNSPVSLQKHGIRYAFSKLGQDEFKQIFTKIWCSTNNSSLREIIFKLTYKLLCKKNSSSIIVDDIWDLLNMFIENLSVNENKIILTTLNNLSDLPIKIRGKYCERIYIYLKSIPSNADCDNKTLNIIFEHTMNIMENIDPNFMASILLEFIDKKFIKSRNTHFEIYYSMDALASYLLCNKNEESECQRYEAVLVPLLERSFDSWDAVSEREYYVRENFYNLLTSIGRCFELYILHKNMIVPVNVFMNTQQYLERKLSCDDNYILMRSWKLATAFVKLVDSYKKSSQCSEKWIDVCSETITCFGDVCSKTLNDDIELFFPSIYLLLSEAIEIIFMDFKIPQLVQFKFLMSILRNEKLIYNYLLVIRLIPKYINDDVKPEWNKIRKRILSHPSKQVKMFYWKIFDDPLLVTDT